MVSFIRYSAGYVECSSPASMGKGHAGSGCLLDQGANLFVQVQLHIVVTAGILAART
jgi:hypothetical protein